MANNTRTQNSPPSYIDGIYVKISERYKPPKRITPKLSYSQRLILNKLMQDPIPTYDFSLEESVKNKMHEWREARTKISEARHQRLKDRWKESSMERTEVLNSKDTVVESDNKNSNISKSLYVTESGVLIPMTVASQPNSSQYQISKQFNYSEFESDTSSPFDNMELKTINDLEELAEVLKRETNTKPKEQPAIATTTTITPYIYNNHLLKSYNTDELKTNQINGYYYNHIPIFTPKTFQTQDVDVASPLQTVPAIMKSLQADLETTEVASPLRTVPEIMKSLQADLEGSKSDAVVVLPRSEKSDTLENPFDNLNADLQQMAVKISSMGFPLPRVARACQMLGGNQKKVVEHLLALSDLLVLGFPEQAVINALLNCNNDRDKALDLLIT